MDNKKVIENEMVLLRAELGQCVEKARDLARLGVVMEARSMSIESHAAGAGTEVDTDVSSVIRNNAANIVECAERIEAFVRATIEWLPKKGD